MNHRYHAVSHVEISPKIYHSETSTDATAFAMLVATVVYLPINLSKVKSGTKMNKKGQQEI